jgi:hypothetical protein
VRAWRLEPAVRDGVQERDTQRLVGDRGADGVDGDAPMPADANGRQSSAPHSTPDVAFGPAENERRLPATQVAAPTGATYRGRD